MENNFLIKEISEKEIRGVFDNAKKTLGEDVFADLLTNLVSPKIQTSDYRIEDHFNGILAKSIRDWYLKIKETKTDIASYDFLMKKFGYAHFKDSSQAPELKKVKLFIYAIILQINGKEPMSCWLFDLEDKTSRYTFCYGSNDLNKIFNLEVARMDVHSMRSFCKKFKDFEEYLNPLLSMGAEAEKLGNKNFYEEWFSHSIEHLKSDEQKCTLGASLCEEEIKQSSNTKIKKKNLKLL